MAFLLLPPSLNNCLFNFFSKKNCHFIIRIQHLLFFLLLYFSSNLITPLTTINNVILVNGTVNFITEINTINHFLKNYAQTLNNYYFETKRVRGKQIKVKVVFLAKAANLILNDIFSTNTLDCLSIRVRF